MKLIRNVVFNLLLIMGVAGCFESKVVLDQNDLKLASDTGIPESIILQAKTEGQNLRRLEGTNNDGGKIPAPGITIDVQEDSVSYVMEKLKSKMPAGYMVYVSERNYGIGGKPDYVSILKASTISEVLEVMGTNGWNYDLSPEMVIKRIEEWDERYGLVLIGAGFDWFEAKFKRLPPDMMVFAKEVYEFCPDVVEQGTGSIKALANEMKDGKYLYLWWD